MKLQMVLPQSCKNTLAYMCTHPNISIAERKNTEDAIVELYRIVFHPKG
jgi:hypothetical protein